MYSTITFLMNTEDRIINKLISLEERLERVEQKLDSEVSTKDDTNRILQGQDEIMKILNRSEDERVMTNITLKRHDERITTLEAKVA